MTSYSVFHKLAHAFNCGAKLRVAFGSMIGGYSGPPEGTVLTRIANDLLQYGVHHVVICGGDMVDVRYSGTSGREGQWVESVAAQAVSRNTHIICQDIPSQVAGPCTEMLLYESAVAMMNMSVSGVSGANIPRTSATKHRDHLSPLECKFCAEVLKSCAGMSRRQANEIAKVLIPRYENMLWDPPIGKNFRDCYDIKTLTPTQEWLDIYLKVKRELIELGVPLQYP